MTPIPPGGGTQKQVMAIWYQALRARSFTTRDGIIIGRASFEAFYRQKAPPLWVLLMLLAKVERLQNYLGEPT